MPKILVVDDSEFICATIRQVFLEDEDIEVLTVKTAKEGIDYAKKWQPDLVLLDVLLPDMDGYNTCIVLRNMRRTKRIPVIFITGHDSVENVVKGFEVGAVDYINKPFNFIELKARTYAHLKNKLMTDKMRKLNRELRAALEENRRIAIEDSLTGLFNRRYGMEYMENYQAKKDRQPSAVLMGDIDDFKKINDSYGHRMGDYVLCEIGEILKKEAGEKNLVCRWGGEEILMMFHDCDSDKAIERGRCICERISGNLFRYGEYELHCSITLGVAVYDGNMSIERTINCADDALYVGKNAGKNCCILYEEE